MTTVTEKQATQFVIVRGGNVVSKEAKALADGRNKVKERLHAFLEKRRSKSGRLITVIDPNKKVLKVISKNESPAIQAFREKLAKRVVVKVANVKPTVLKKTQPDINHLGTDSIVAFKTFREGLFLRIFNGPSGTIYMDKARQAVPAHHHLFKLQSFNPKKPENSVKTESTRFARIVPHNPAALSDQLKILQETRKLNNMKR